MNDLGPEASVGKWRNSGISADSGGGHATPAAGASKPEKRLGSGRNSENSSMPERPDRQPRARSESRTSCEEPMEPMPMRKPCIRARVSRPSDQRIPTLKSIPIPSARSQGIRHVQRRTLPWMTHRSGRHVLGRIFPVLSPISWNLARSHRFHTIPKAHGQAG